MQDTGPAPGGGILVSIVQLGAATSCGLSRTTNSIEELILYVFAWYYLVRGCLTTTRTER